MNKNLNCDFTAKDSEIRGDFKENVWNYNIFEKVWKIKEFQRYL